MKVAKPSEIRITVPLTDWTAVANAAVYGEQRDAQLRATERKLANCRADIRASEAAIGWYKRTVLAVREAVIAHDEARLAEIAEVIGIKFRKEIEAAEAAKAEVRDEQ